MVTFWIYIWKKNCSLLKHLSLWRWKLTNVLLNWIEWYKIMSQMINNFVVWCLTPFFSYIAAASASVHGFLEFYLTSTHHNILSKQLIDWMVFYAAFNSTSVISRWPFKLFMSFLGFTSTRLGLWSVLPKDTLTKKPRGSSAARTQDPWITSQPFYHWATQDPPPPPQGNDCFPTYNHCRTTDSDERGKNPVSMTIMNPRKDYWPSRGSNQRPPVLKPATLSTELWGSAQMINKDELNIIVRFEPCSETRGSTCVPEMHDT